MKIKDFKFNANAYILAKSLDKKYLLEDKLNYQFIQQYSKNSPYYKSKFESKIEDFTLGNLYIDIYMDLINTESKESLDLDLDRLGKIGIDRVKLYVDIKSMDIENIFNKNSLGIVRDNNGLEIVDKSTGEYIYINKYNYTSVENIQFLNSKNYRYKIEIQQIANPSKGTSQYKTVLDATIPRIRNEFHNIYNIHNRDDVELTFATVINELEDKGIDINLENAEVLSLEINKTFRWQNSIADEEDILDYLFKILRRDKSNRNKSEVHKKVRNKNKESFTYSLDTKRTKIKIYTKSEHIVNTIGYECGEHLCRVELTLNKSGINNSFGTNEISILNDIDKLKNIFLSSIDKKVIKPLKKRLKEEIKEIEKLIVNCNYRTLDKVYKSISKELFDIVLLGVAASNVYTKKGKSNFKRDFSNLLNTVSKGHKQRYSVLIRLLSSIMGVDIDFLDIPKNVQNCL